MRGEIKLEYMNIDLSFLSDKSDFEILDRIVCFRKELEFVGLGSIAEVESEEDEGHEMARVDKIIKKPKKNIGRPELTDLERYERFETAKKAYIAGDSLSTALRGAFRTRSGELTIKFKEYLKEAGVGIRQKQVSINRKDSGDKLASPKDISELAYDSDVDREIEKVVKAPSVKSVKDSDDGVSFKVPKKLGRKGHVVLPRIVDDDDDNYFYMVILRKIINSRGSLQYSSDAEELEVSSQVEWDDLMETIAGKSEKIAEYYEVDDSFELLQDKQLILSYGES